MNTENVNVENLQFMSRIALIIAIVAFLISVLLFFLFNVPKLFSELTGRAEKKFIAEAKKKNEHSEPDTSFGTSEALLSSELISETLSTSVSKVATTKLTPLDETTRLSVNPLVQEANQKNSAVNHGDEFSIIEEFSFTSSTEIIE